MGRADTVDLSARVDALTARVAALEAGAAEGMRARVLALLRSHPSPPPGVAWLDRETADAWTRARHDVRASLLGELVAAVEAMPPEGAAPPRGGAGSARGGAEGAEGSREAPAGAAGAVAGEGEVAT